MTCNDAALRRLRALLPLALSVALLAPLATRCPAATYTYTIKTPAPVTSNWSSGTAAGWDSTPVSGSSTALVFQGSLGIGSIRTSNNNLGEFTLNSLAISATGPNVGSSSFTISGDPLRFVVNSGTQPSAITVVSGSTVPAIQISANVILDDHLSADLEPVTATLTVAGVVSGSGTLDKTGSGILILGVDTVVNTFAGDTRSRAGSLYLGSAGALAGSTLDMRTGDAGSLDFGLSASTFTLGGLKGSRAISAGDNTLSIGGNGQSTTYSGGISGTGGLVKTGTGALTLAGTSTFSGPTTVQSGSLILDGGLANSNVTVQLGGLLSGTGSIGGDLTVGGTLSPGSIGALTVSGSVTLQNGATTLLEVTGSTTFDEIIGTGAAFTNDGALVLSIDAPGAFANNTLFGLVHGFATPHLGSFDTVTMFATGTYAALNNTPMTTGTLYGPDIWVSDWVNSDGNGQNGQRFLFDQTNGTLALVPEPTTWALAAVAAGMLGTARLRRRRAARKTAA